MQLYERIFYKRLIIIKEKLVALQLIYLLKQVYIFTYTNDILGKCQTSHRELPVRSTLNDDVYIYRILASCITGITFYQISISPSFNYLENLDWNIIKIKLNNQI